jgi:hypothetical protein
MASNTSRLSGSFVAGQTFGVIENLKEQIEEISLESKHQERTEKIAKIEALFVLFQAFVAETTSEIVALIEENARLKTRITEVEKELSERIETLKMAVGELSDRQHDHMQPLELLLLKYSVHTQPKQEDSSRPSQNNNNSSSSNMSGEIDIRDLLPPLPDLPEQNEVFLNRCSEISFSDSLVRPNSREQDEPFLHGSKLREQVQRILQDD